MRIIAGKFKGKKLCEFELTTTRPTSDLVKGAVFNILGEKVSNSVFLDLFSGTGAMGIEALSRDAKYCIFNDMNSESIKIIKKNLNSIKCDNFEVLNNSFIETLKILENKKQKLDIVFLDPPYKTDFAEKSIKLIKSLNLLSEGAVIVWEHDEDKLNVLKEFNVLKTKKYGKKYLSIIE